MSKQVSFDISKIKNEENKVRWKLSKNRKWLIIENCQKWKVFLLKITCSKMLQMKFCSTWKLYILLSPFQKVQEHEFLMCGWQVMDWSLSKKVEFQSGITFDSQGQMEWGFFEQNSFDVLYPKQALPVMKTHHTKSPFFKWTNFEFGGKKCILRNKPCFHMIPLAIAHKYHLKLAATRNFYCYIGFA
jgi:hypothetical protein